jgi:hypothetical protein
MAEEHIQMNLFDEEILHPNCTVQELRNTETGEASFGWWENESPPKGAVKEEPGELARLRAFYEEISSLPDCNTCMKKNLCEFRPRPGEHCRINCPAWMGERKEERE